MYRYILIGFVLCFSGCATLDGLISPEQQCSLLRRGTYLGAQFGLKEVKDKVDCEKYIALLKEKAIDKLSEKSEITREAWEGILKVLDDQAEEFMKGILRQGIMLMMQYVELPAGQEKGMSLGERFTYYAKCMFYGIVDFLSQMAKAQKMEKKDIDKISLYKEFGEVYNQYLKEKKCKSCP